MTQADSGRCSHTTRPSALKNWIVSHANTGAQSISLTFAGHCSVMLTNALLNTQYCGICNLTVNGVIHVAGMAVLGPNFILVFEKGTHTGPPWGTKGSFAAPLPSDVTRLSARAERSWTLADMVIASYTYLYWRRVLQLRERVQPTEHLLRFVRLGVSPSLERNLL